MSADLMMTDEDLIEMFGDKEVRWYQVLTRNMLAVHLTNGVKRILIKKPTGTGKSLTIAFSLSSDQVRKALKIPAGRKLRVLFIAHNHRLLTQAERTFIDSCDIDLILQSTMSAIPESVVNQGWDITVIDECHHEATMSFQYHLDKLGEHPIIGLTATDQRADNYLLKFEETIEAITREQAVEEGHISPSAVRSIVDVPTKSKTPVLCDIFNNYADQMGNGFVFVKTRKEVAEITAHLQQLGYPTVGLLNQSAKEIDYLLDAFSDNQYKFVVNCGRLGEGIDVKGCTDVILGRQLGSYVLYNQIVGRTVRPDSPSTVWELINPLSGRNLDATVVVGVPTSHKLIYRERGEWKEQEFDHTSIRSNSQFGISKPSRMTRAA